jgi:cytochrome c peroxidase
MKFFLFLIPLVFFSHSISAGWSDSELRILRSLSLSALPSLPPSLSNRFADDSRAIELGKKIFFDARFSSTGKISCASCHQPDKHFTDQRKTAMGVHMGKRNTPTLVASGWLRWFYWDGRRDSLWSQALIPFEAIDEMAGSRTQLVWHISNNTDYLNKYESLFGKIPNELKLDKKVVSASPLGNRVLQDNWYRIPNDKKVIINTVFVNIGKAVAAYERTLVPQETKFDQYVSQLLSTGNGDIDIKDDEIAGIKLFIDPNKTQCMQCHNGPLLTNGGFHNIGTGKFSGENLDFGRVFGIQAVLMDEFNCLGNYSDANKEDCHQLRFLDKTQHHIPLEGAFKTPSLRNLAMTWPYFHDGRHDSLTDVIRHYNEPPVNNGMHELKALNLTEVEVSQLVSFLQMLN